MQGGYNMNIRCNQKLVFCKDRGIDFGVWLCRAYACNMYTQHFWGFLLYHPALFGISTLPPGTIGDSHFITGWEDEAFQRFNRFLKLNFRCRRDNNYISRVP